MYLLLLLLPSANSKDCQRRQGATAGCVGWQRHSVAHDAVVLCWCCFMLQSCGGKRCQSWRQICGKQTML